MEVYVTPELARRQLDLVVEQLKRLEARAGRRAVRVSVAVPTHLDVEYAHEILSSELLRERTLPFDIEVVPSEGRPRLLTVDFELSESR